MTNFFFFLQLRKEFILFFNCIFDFTHLYFRPLAWTIYDIFISFLVRFATHANSTYTVLDVLHCSSRFIYTFIISLTNFQLALFSLLFWAPFYELSEFLSCSTTDKITLLFKACLKYTCNHIVPGVFSKAVRDIDPSISLAYFCLLNLFVLNLMDKHFPKTLCLAIISKNIFTVWKRSS